jgi:paraquat-inducible protein B
MGVLPREEMPRNFTQKKRCHMALLVLDAFWMLPAIALLVVLGMLINIFSPIRPEAESASSA